MHGLLKISSYVCQLHMPIHAVYSVLTTPDCYPGAVKTQEKDGQEHINRLIMIINYQIICYNSKWLTKSTAAHGVVKRFIERKTYLRYTCIQH